LVADLGLAQLKLGVELQHHQLLVLHIHFVDGFECLRQILLFQFPHAFGVQRAVFGFLIISSFLFNLLQRDVGLE
jgi:hypothetical protein